MHNEKASTLVTPLPCVKSNSSRVTLHAANSSSEVSVHATPQATPRNKDITMNQEAAWMETDQVKQKQVSVATTTTDVLTEDSKTVQSAAGTDTDTENTK